MVQLSGCPRWRRARQSLLLKTSLCEKDAMAQRESFDDQLLEISSPATKAPFAHF